MDLRSMTLLQPEAVIAARVPVAGIANLADLIKRIVHGSETVGAAQGLVVAIIVKPGSLMRVWCELVPEPDRTSESALEKELGKAVAPEASDVVAFAMHFARGPVEIPQIPRAWREVAAAQGQPVRIPDAIVAALWPDAG